MKSHDPSPHRKSPVHQPIHWPPDMAVVLFLTVNTKLKKSVLARPDVHDLLRDAWAIADDWQVGRYVIMPEHLHLLCAPRNPDAPLERWMRFWKSLSSRRWPRPEEHPIWQRGYWDTQLRRNESYEEKWEYMRHNPVRRRLVTRPEDWPFAGTITTLEWPGE